MKKILKSIKFSGGLTLGIFTSIFLVSSVYAISATGWTTNGQNTVFDGTGAIGIGTSNLQNAKINISDPGVPLSFTESDQTGTGAMWRMPLDGGILRFDKSNNGTDFTNYSTILSLHPNSNVGINTLNPVQGQLQIDSFSVPLAFRSTTTPGAGAMWRMPLINGTLRFDASQNGSDFSNYTNPLSLLPNGSVGINTLSPTEKLQVQGNIKVNGNIVSDGDICIGKCN